VFLLQADAKEARIRAKIRGRGKIAVRSKQPFTACADASAQTALGAGFGERLPSVTANDVKHVNTAPLHHVIHELLAVQDLFEHRPLRHSG
jgi:hypothetical protein